MRRNGKMTPLRRDLRRDPAIAVSVCMIAVGLHERQHGAAAVGNAFRFMSITRSHAAIGYSQGGVIGAGHAWPAEVMPAKSNLVITAPKKPSVL